MNTSCGRRKNSGHPHDRLILSFTGAAPYVWIGSNCTLAGLNQSGGVHHEYPDIRKTVHDMTGTFCRKKY